MYLNELLRVSDNLQLEELLAFCLMKGVDWKDYYYSWNDESERQIQSILTTWVKKDLIVCIKNEDLTTTWNFKIKCFLDEEPKDLKKDIDISLYRDLFSINNLGVEDRMSNNKKELKAAMLEFLKTNPKYSYEEILKVVKDYIFYKKRLQESTFVPKDINLIRTIDKDTGEVTGSKLKTLLENPIKTNTYGSLL